ncbi:hypothetical protein F2Q69_00044821 [Brassica cretica]|uniref:Protein kinase domain-containing protein n=1 Tax=Brassica cretica TaxID=69181 RepID=A0A8S9NJE9_BRACR|nr:hypothetical protein F2Q69_00044821 [Brassica cretica]
MTPRIEGFKYPYREELQETILYTPLSRLKHCRRRVDFTATTINTCTESHHTAAKFQTKLKVTKDAPGEGKTHVSTRVMGTNGYAAPEYVMTGECPSLVLSF